MRLVLAAISCFVLGVAISAGLDLGSRLGGVTGPSSRSAMVFGPAWTASHGAHAPVLRLPVAEQVVDARVATPRLGRGVRAVLGRYSASRATHHVAGVVLEAPWTAASAVALSCTASRFEAAPGYGVTAPEPAARGGAALPIGWPASPWSRMGR